MVELSKLSDLIIEQMEELRSNNLSPAYIIVGRLEYYLIIQDMKQNPTLVLDDDKGQGVKFLGAIIVPDFLSPSRITVTPFMWPFK